MDSTTSARPPRSAKRERVPVLADARIEYAGVGKRRATFNGQTYTVHLGCTIQFVKEDGQVHEVYRHYGSWRCSCESCTFTVPHMCKHLLFCQAADLLGD